MIVSSRPLRAVVAMVLVATLALGVAACSKKNSGGTDNGTTTIVLQYFGSPGFDQAVKDFQAVSPNVKVDVQNMGQLKDFQPKLVQRLAAGKGAGDVVMLEEGTLLGFLQDHQNFTNLLDLGAGALKSDFLPYKWQNGFTADGKKLVGIGTDVGGLAMCYRTDLFAKAGLPTDRDQVSALWPTWDAYAAVGRKFKARNTGAAWVDSATSITQPYIMQSSDTWFYSRDDTFIGDRNPVVKKAWDFGLGLAAEGLTAKLVRWSPDWDAAYQNAAFATVPCPAWMTGVIAERAGDRGEGRWDVATIPGNGGNWGGSYLAIPQQSKHKEQAFQLLRYLTGRDGQLAEYQAVGALPSNVKALDDPRFSGSTNAYFSDAPTGRIFGASAKAIKPIYLGPKHQQLWENVFEPQMQAAERGKSSSAAAWRKAIGDGKKLAEG
jgi:cellobiose transport system substrate-binding protein